MSIQLEAVYAIFIAEKNINQIQDLEEYKWDIVEERIAILTIGILFMGSQMKKIRTP